MSTPKYLKPFVNLALTSLYSDQPLEAFGKEFFLQVGVHASQIIASKDLLSKRAYITAAIKSFIKESFGMITTPKNRRILHETMISRIVDGDKTSLPGFAHPVPRKYMKRLLQCRKSQAS